MKRMKPAEVAKIYGVGTSTVRRWAEIGLLQAYKTPLGHRRYDRSEVEALLNRERVRVREKLQTRPGVTN